MAQEHDGWRWWLVIGLVRLFEKTLKYHLGVFQAAWSDNIYFVSLTFPPHLFLFHLSFDLVRLMTSGFVCFVTLLTVTLGRQVWVFFGAGSACADSKFRNEENEVWRIKIGLGTGSGLAVAFMASWLAWLGYLA